MRMDGGLGVVVRLEGDQLEIQDTAGTTRHQVDQIARVTVRKGWWSRRGVLEFRLTGGETVRVPFARDQRANAREIRARVLGLLRPSSTGASPDFARKRAEVQQRVEELRRGNAENIERRRQAIEERIARGEASADAREEFEREAARLTAAVEREADQLLRKAEEMARLLEGRGGA